MFEKPSAISLEFSFLLEDNLSNSSFPLHIISHLITLTNLVDTESLEYIQFALFSIERKKTLSSITFYLIYISCTDKMQRVQFLPNPFYNMTVF